MECLQTDPVLCLVKSPLDATFLKQMKAPLKLNDTNSQQVSHITWKIKLQGDLHDL